MSKQSMAALRERRAELGLVQMNLWIREEDRAEFEAAAAPFRARAAEIDPAHKPGRKPQEAVREPNRRSPAQRPPQTSQRPSDWLAERRAWLTLPCRLTFPNPPPASLRNEMKAAGWRYDRDSGIWVADQIKLAKAWLPELVEGWGAVILGAADT